MKWQRSGHIVICAGEMALATVIVASALENGRRMERTVCVKNVKFKIG